MVIISPTTLKNYDIQTGMQVKEILKWSRLLIKPVSLPTLPLTIVRLSIRP